MKSISDSVLYQAPVPDKHGLSSVKLPVLIHTILLHLVQHYDKEKKFTFDPEKEPKDYNEMLQWIFFAVRDCSSSDKMVSL